MSVTISKQVVRIKVVVSMVGVSRSTIYDWINKKSPRFDPTFPRPIKLGSNSVGWLKHQVIEWIESRPF